MEYNTPTSYSCSGIALCKLHLREREIHPAERERALLELERRWRGGEQWPYTGKGAWQIPNLYVQVCSLSWLFNRLFQERPQTEEEEENKEDLRQFRGYHHRGSKLLFTILTHWCDSSRWYFLSISISPSSHWWCSRAFHYRWIYRCSQPHWSTGRHTTVNAGRQHQWANG